MSTIVVRNFPEDLLERLKHRAARNHRLMTKEVVHLLAAGLGSDPSPAIADHPLEPNKKIGGREAFRAALIKQTDGTFVNVFGIDDRAFFDTLERIRMDAKAPDVAHLFDEKP